MKKLTLLFTVLLAVFYINAQNNVAINNDGSTAIASAMLDVKSTTKGFMMPRMASADRVAIQNPVVGLLVFDTDTKTIWAHDGNSWKNLYTSGGLTLPYSQGVNLATSGFQVSNQGIGTAIEGSSSAQFGIGMTAKTTGEGGWGLYAFSNGAGSQSIRSYADNGTAFHGENNNAANTNTLMSLMNKGAGKTGTFQLANSTSTSANVQIAGNHLGEQLLIYQTNPANAQSAVTINNSGTGAGLTANSTGGGNGIMGITNAVSKSGVRGEAGTGSNGIYGFNNGTGAGVRGESINGTGMIAYSTSGIGINASSINGVGVHASSFGDNAVEGSTSAVSKSGVRGEAGTGSNGVFGVNTGTGPGVRGESNTGTGIIAYSTSGTGLYANSISGKALEVSGNLKIAGGNTNPGSGKILTSDASGNATWQAPVAAPKIAFKVSDVITVDGTTNIFPAGQYKRVQYKNVEYDISNSFEIYAGSEAGDAGTFRAPIGGVYHFDAAVNFLFATTFDYREINMELRVYRNGVTSTLARTGSYINSVDNTLATLSTDVRLYANDIVWIVVDQWNTVSLPSPLVAGIENYFNGHLVFQY